MPLTTGALDISVAELALASLFIGAISLWGRIGLGKSILIGAVRCFRQFPCGAVLVLANPFSLARSSTDNHGLCAQFYIRYRISMGCSAAFLCHGGICSPHCPRKCFGKKHPFCFPFLCHYDFGVYSRYKHSQWINCRGQAVLAPPVFYSLGRYGGRQLHDRPGPVTGPVAFRSKNKTGFGGDAALSGRNTR